MAGSVATDSTASANTERSATPTPPLPLGELVLYGLLFALGTSMAMAAVPLGLGGRAEVGAGAMPMGIGIFLAAAAAVLAVSTCVRRPSKGAQEEAITPDGFKKLALVVAALAAWPLLVNTLGFVVLSFSTAFGIAKAFGYPGWGRPTLFSAGVAFFIWLIFYYLFTIDLPAGFMG